MNWEAIGAIGEVVGAFAVVLTLVYLTMQVRQADLGIRASTYQHLLAERANVNMTISANGALANIVRRGFSGDELDPDERQRLHGVALQAFLLFNSAHRLYQSGVIDDDDWRTDAGLIAAWKSWPGFSSWWPIQRHLFNPTFADLVDECPIDPASQLENLLEWMGVHDTRERRSAAGRGCVKTPP